MKASLLGLLLLHAWPPLILMAGPVSSAVFHPQHLSLVTQLFSSTEETDILGEWSGKFHLFCCLEKEPVALLFFAEPGTAFLLILYFSFPVFPRVPIYMHSKTAAPDMTVGWSPCFRK